jgi:hypothetical protein
MSAGEIANLNSNSITEYTAGQQNTNATITNGIAAPLALAIDGLHDVSVQNSNTHMTIYAPAIGLMRTLITSEQIVVRNNRFWRRILTNS